MAWFLCGKPHDCIPDIRSMRYLNPPHDWLLAHDSCSLEPRVDCVPREAWIEPKLLMKKLVVLEPPFTSMLHGLSDNEDGISQSILSHSISVANWQEGKEIHDSKVATSLT